MFNSYPYYNRYNNYYNRVTPYTPTFYQNLQNNFNIPKAHTEEVKDITEDLQTKKNENTDPQIKQNLESKNENKNSKHRTIPFSLENNTLSLFGFDIAIDDLLIIGIILILLLDSECNYALIIVLGLMFFNINFSSLNLF